MAQQPYQIDAEVRDVGKTIKQSKTRATWKFAFGTDPRAYVVTLKNSRASGKKVVEIGFAGQQQRIHESSDYSKPWRFSFKLQHGVPYNMRVEITEDGIYQLFCNKQHFLGTSYAFAWHL